MSVQKRKCSSCKFFDQAPLPGNGWCTHPKRQVSSEVRILVRSGELACRNSWGGDFWVSNIAAPNVEMPGDQGARDRLVASSRSDDQITSVTPSFASQPADHDPSTFGSQGFSRETAPDDVIVSQPSMLPEDAQPAAQQHPFERDQSDLNLPAHEDQQERARIIARGNRDAIVKARERHMRRRGGSERVPGTAITDVEDVGDLAAKGAGSELHDDGTETDRFAADAGPLITRKSGRRPREQRAGQGMQSRGYADPTPPVPVDEVSERSWQSPLVSRREDVNRFESVPDIEPDVALPQLRKFLQTNDPDADALGGTSAAGSPGQAETTYDRVLQRAQAIKTATQKERNARLIRNRPASRQAPTFQPARSRASLGTDDIDDSESLVHSAEDDHRAEAEHGPLSTESLRSLDYVTIDAEPDHDPAAGTLETDEFFDDDEFVDEELSAADESTYGHTAERSRIAPQQSWWRGLTLGFGRRPRHDAESGSVPGYPDADDEWSDEESESTTYWSLEDQDDDPEDLVESDRSSERIFSFSHNGQSAPEPVVALRDSRTAEDELVDYELTDEVLETTFADDADRIQAESWREDGRSRAEDDERELAYANRSRKDSGFALEDQHDMDAFRAVLFGDGSVNAVDRRGSQRYRQPYPVPRDEVAASREALAADDIPVAAHERYVEEPVFDIRNFVGQDDDLLDMRVQIAPDVPRACRTCRDFRPSESGERGWCTNDFAFTHRQMVNADDMPCQSSIGCWWLPNDDAWMPEADFAARENPTPFTDRLIARRNGREPGGNRSHPGLYVREM